MSNKKKFFIFSSSFFAGMLVENLRQEYYPDERSFPQLRGTYHDKEFSARVMVFEGTSMTQYIQGGEPVNEGTFEQDETYENVYYLLNEEEELDQLIILSEDNKFYYYDRETEEIFYFELNDEVPTYVIPSG